MLREYLTFTLVFLAMLAKPAVAQPYERYEATHMQMGTEFRIALYAADSMIAKEIFAAAWEELDALNLTFSDYDNGSELNRLCRNYTRGVKQEISNDLWQLLLISRDLSDVTNGAFDVTVGPLTKLWRYGMRRQQIPDSAKIAETILKVGYQGLTLSQNEFSVVFDREEMQLDFGAIAKGYALDEISGLLRDSGIQHFLIDGGGDLLLGNAPPGRPG